MRKLAIAGSADEIAQFRTLWERLAAAPGHTIFQSFEWNRLAAQIFSDEQPPFVVIAESDSGVAIIPACIDKRQRRISLLGEELFDYRDVLHIGDPTLLHDAWEAIFDYAAQNNLGFGFHSYRAESPDTGWHRLPLTAFTNAPCTYAKDTQPAHPHSEVSFRRLSRAGITRHQYSGTHAQMLERIYSLKSQEPNSLFSDPLRVKMLLAMAHIAASHCEVFTLESGTTLVAALVTFRDRNWRRFYTTYFDRAWAKHSPGSTLLYLVMQESLASGLDCDLMTGDQPYKRRLASNAVPLYRISISAEQIREWSLRLLAVAI